MLMRCTTNDWRDIYSWRQNVFLWGIFRLVRACLKSRKFNIKSEMKAVTLRFITNDKHYKGPRQTKIFL